jgi:uncharacterized repeat protein (TIGR02543 family)
LSNLRGRHLEIAIPLPAYLSGETVYAVYRAHDYGGVTGMRVDTLTTNSAQGEYFYQDGDWVIIRADKFSAFALAVSDPSQSFSLTVSAGAGGSVTGTTSGGYRYGSPVSLRAQPHAGYVFSGWTVNGVTVGSTSANPLTFQMPGNGVGVTATFSAIPPDIPPEAAQTVAGTKTGDDANVALWIVLMAAGALGTAGALTWRKRRQTDG